MAFIINEDEKQIKTIMPEIYKCINYCPYGETNLLLNKMDYLGISNQHLLKYKEILIQTLIQKLIFFFSTEF